MPYIGRTSIVAALALSVSISNLDASTSCGQPKKNDSPETIGCRMKNGICFIRDSIGGDLDIILKDAQRYALIVIDGPCASSCALAAEKYHYKVRITPRASFVYHQVQDWVEVKIAGKWCFIDTGKRTPYKHIKPVQNWIDAHGGEPRNGELTMSFKAAIHLGVWRLYGDEPQDIFESLFGVW